MPGQYFALFGVFQSVEKGADMRDNPDERERDLVRRAAVDADAFQALYHRYFRRVYAYVASRTEDERDAEDIVSDVFLRVVKNLNTFRSQQEAGFAAWLFAIARNAITDYYRRNGRATPTVDLEAAEPLAESEREPERIAARVDAEAQLRGLLAGLPERKREIVTLRYYSGLRNHEIAAVLGIGEKTVSAHLSRALAELQEQVAASLVQDELGTDTDG